MTTIGHDTFTIQQEIKASHSRVFTAWAKPDLKRRWFVDQDDPGWVEREFSSDFKVGGWERGTFLRSEGPGAGEHHNATVYLDIVEGERIVYAYTMALDGRVHSVSLSTVEFADQGGGTRVTYTEQGTFIGDSDEGESRQRGWSWLLNNLRQDLEAANS